jgi:nicotinate-nucleotide adenylyltransferase
MNLLVGSDVLKDVERWHAFEEVQRLAPMYVLARAGHPEAGLPLVLPEVSSTKIRAELAAEPRDDAWLSRVVPFPVLRHIDEHGIYGATLANG